MDPLTELRIIDGANEMRTIGVAEGDREAAGEVEAPRPILPPNSTWRYVMHAAYAVSPLLVTDNIATGSKYERNLPVHNLDRRFSKHSYTPQLC
jgi:hypothetical protein